ncbi:unnamed protein product (macronuclear) [Paramecium tetraurelia]|uniref:Uncharacterized protein n=1 Tax=Paramecium tetraurelia TaxID=5888 RepID=A0C3K4_PARTE|nr:uncharacterized protein GSPATT00034850001 [Paramecium tetraurelia]CAK65371.1 unnamed protein product [Paramecium tetraurelia]|eukprot:XP_001432768.1 hypothetical protein (macronuclear) [Paramecium tetraurelia strain d4-2]
MSKLSIQVDFQFIKLGILTKLEGLTHPYYEVTNEYRNYQIKIQHNKFKDFIVNELKVIKKLLDQEYPLQNEVSICGYGLQDQEEFTYYSDIFEKELDLKLIKQRSVHNSIKAIDYLMSNKEGAFYQFNNLINLREIHLLREGYEIGKVVCPCPKYPYLYLNVNKSVSFYKVQAVNQFVKLNGSLITDTTIEKIFQLIGLDGDINEQLTLAFKEGNNLNADMTVEDIYGKSYTSLGLSKDIIAASMGKLQTKEPTSVNVLDVVKSLWFMFAINLGQLAALNAQLEDLTTIIVGSSKITYEPFLLSLQSVLTFFGAGKLNIIYIENMEFLTCLSPFENLQQIDKYVVIHFLYEFLMAQLLDSLNG